MATTAPMLPGHRGLLTVNMTAALQGGADESGGVEPPAPCVEVTKLALGQKGITDVDVTSIAALLQQFGHREPKGMPVWFCAKWCNCN